jgi:mannose-6-phosphate isomerase-like protein (cupin superfamily)/DNA-directed RNA polymerase subunit RPC12/RpoP
LHVKRAADREPAAGGRVDVGSALGTTNLAVVRYRLAPGEGLPSGLHAHYDQEEVFVVRDGAAAFEVLPRVEAWGDGRPTGGTVTVGSGEAIRFAPGEFQTGRNPAGADGVLDVVAIGAPKDTDDVHIPAGCPDCEARTLALGTGGERFTLDCADCSAQFEPGPCERCGSEALGMHLDDDERPVSRCGDCGHEHPAPPLRD